MLYDGQDGQTICTAGKVKPLYSSVCVFLPGNTVRLWRDSSCTGEFYYSVHIKTQRHQITLKHLLDVAFDLLKRPEKSCFWQCRCVPVSIYAEMRRMTEVSRLRGRALSLCSNTARNGVIRCNLGAGRFKLMEIEVKMELSGLIHYFSS